MQLLKALTHRSYHIMILITLCICTLNPIKKKKIQVQNHDIQQKHERGQVLYMCTPDPNTYNVIRHTVSVTHTNAHTQHANIPTHRAAAEEAAAVSRVSRVFCMIASTLQKRRKSSEYGEWQPMSLRSGVISKRNCKKTREKIIHAILSPY